MPLLALMLCIPMGCVATQPGPAPWGLMVELASQPELLTVHDAQPEFSWIVPTTRQGDVQTAYRLQVAESACVLESGADLLWDSGKVQSNQSTAVSYAGDPLPTGAGLAWRVKTWNVAGEAGAWSAPQAFKTADELHDTAAMPVALDGLLDERFTLAGYPLQETRVGPSDSKTLADGTLWIDFAKHAFGTVELTLDEPVTERIELTVRLGEKLNDAGRVDTKPGGTIRYQQLSLTLEPGKTVYRIQVQVDRRNTGINAIPIPESLGVIMPFRYAEIIGMPAGLTLRADQFEQVRVHYPFDLDAASFDSSNETLNAIWAFCQYSMKATSFAGIYVDGDRERIPYEADAYLNQLIHYAVDREFTLARRSHEYLIQRATWPTEWPLHSVLMAGADYQYTGDTESAEAFFDDLKAKTLLALAREDGLISTRDGRLTQEVLDSIYERRLQDIVDWPQGERDNYDFRDYNTVVNAMHYRTLVVMAELAQATGRDDEAARFTRLAKRHHASFNRAFFNPETGLYVDGEGSDHSSLHANAFPLAFGLVPEDRVPAVLEFVKSKGLACSVYAAQYLLEALCMHGEEAYALELILNESDRGWVNMMRVGSTVSLEAWDIKYKKNLDWNHAWGAAPGNIIPRFFLGVRLAEAGFAKATIEPKPVGLERIAGTVPTIRGSIGVDYRATEAGYELVVTLPANVPSTLTLPGEPQSATLNGEPVNLAPNGSTTIDLPGGGTYNVIARSSE